MQDNLDNAKNNNLKKNSGMSAYLLKIIKQKMKR